MRPSLFHSVTRSVSLVAATLWALAIPALSLLPAPYFSQVGSIVLVRIPHADKIVHAGLYGVLTGLMLGCATPPVPARRFWFTALAATAYGLLMELLQCLTATRTMDLFDGLANAAGAFLVAGVALGVARVRARGRSQVEQETSRI